jgi:Putative zincin peptidase
MKIKPEELIANNYILLDSLSHKELVPFVNKYMKKITAFSLIYLFSNLIIAGVITYLFLKNNNENHISFGKAAIHFSYGFAIAFLLIPVHEVLHGLAYKLLGAPHTSYKANFKKFYFIAVADRFVASEKEFLLVALTPFITITITLVIALFFAGRIWTFTTLGVLLIHTAFCSGDFALLSYFQFNKEKDIVTYDDKEKGMSYFYGRAKQ